MVKLKTLVTIIGIALVILTGAILAIVLVLRDQSNDDVKTTARTKESPRRGPLVTIPYGIVEGKKHTLAKDDKSEKFIYEYKNIPYALPPIGERRWRPPTPMIKQNGWNGTLKYSNKTVKCMQKYKAVGSVSGQEDCLILSVRSPTLNGNSSLPVLVWFHGGGFLWGYNDGPGFHPNNEFTASLDVVTVSVNYRLNAFGFLSLEELWINSGPDRSYGNYGIMDMIQALKWIKENIRYFGGDPDRVTIFGESSGATGVYSLLASNPAKGLFQKAIAASGAPNIRMNHHQANVIFRSFLNNTNCMQNTSSERKKCLLNLDADIVTEYAPWFRPVPGLPLSFTYAHIALVSYQYGFPENRASLKIPIEIIDPVVIQRSPDQIISSGNTVQVDVALSNLAQEIPITPPDVVTDIKSLRSTLGPKIASFNASYDSIFAIYNRNTSDYVRPKEISPEYLYTTMATDVRMSCSVNDLVEYLSSLPDYNVYRFVISQPPSPVNGVEQRAYHDWDTRALFGFKEKPGFKPSSDELKLMKNLREFYKNFLHEVSTFSFKHQNKTTVFWNNSVNVFNQPYHEEECKFWRDNGFLKFSWGNTGV